MAPEVAKNTKLYSMEWDDELEAVLFRWNDFAAGERFREGANRLLQYIRSKNATKLIVDTSGITAHRDEDEEWLVQEWIPKIIEAGVKYSATVRQDSAIAKMDMEDFITRIEEHDYVSMMTADMEEAREWIANK